MKPTATPATPAVAKVASLHVYPLKSAAGIAVPAVDVDEVGLRLDRRWMVVDEAGAFVSQRTLPAMALLGTELTTEGVRVTFPRMASFLLPSDADDGPAAPPVTVRVWHEDRFGVDCGDEIAGWMSEALGARCRVLRAVEPADGVRVRGAGLIRAGFADARPALAISTASLDDLNRRLAEQGVAPLPMNRFRPNLVVDGVEPYAEETWGTVRAGEVLIHGIKPCPRCVTTTVDQARGVADGPEPLRTLATYRRMDDGGAAFGMNVGFGGTGTLRVGDAVEVVEP